MHHEFLCAKRLWDNSRDCTELVADLERLLDAGKLRDIKKIICFGFGQFFIDESRESFSLGRWCLTNRRMAQHAAALTIAEVLNKRQGGEKVALLAQDPSYFKEDKSVLQMFGFRIVDPSHGVQEGFVEVDEHSLVMTFDFGDRVQQVVCETARPAAMIWSAPDEACECCVNNELHLSPTCDVLAAEYWEMQPSYLMDA